MIDNNNNYLNSSDIEPDLPPPRFDKHASANAQPVEPIPARGFAVSFQRTHSLLSTMQIKTKALAFLLVGGMAIGALGGTLLVKERHSSSEAAVTVSDPGVGATAPAAGAEGTQTTEGIDGFADALQKSERSGWSTRGRRARRQNSRVPQAYRVGVIR